MYSRLFSLATCLFLLWLCPLALIVDAQQREKGSTNSESVAPDIANLRDQASRADAMAEYRLGRVYMKGTGVPVDYKEAAKYLYAADEQGLTEAKAVLGYLYENGKGVPRDYRRAFDYYAAAAKQGDVTAANNLAAMYEHGRGVRKDIGKAVDWYGHAAEGGNVVAQCNLATL